MAETGQLGEVVGRPPPHVGIGMGHVEALGLREQPMETHALEPRAGDRAANLTSLEAREFRDERREGERGDLQARVAAGRRGIAGLGKRPVAEGLVADRVAEWGVHTGFFTRAGLPVRADW